MLLKPESRKRKSILNMKVDYKIRLPEPIKQHSFSKTPRVFGKRSKEPMINMVVRVMPDFCWQTAYEILTMAEIENERLEYETLKAYLSKLLKKKAIEAREYESRACGENERGGYKKFEYKRINSIPSLHGRLHIPNHPPASAVSLSC